MKSLKVCLNLLVIGCAGAALFQNCGKQSFALDTVNSRFGPIDCVVFDNEDPDDCQSSSYGLIGKLYYLLDKTDGSVLPAQVYDKNDLPLPFNGTSLSSVDVLIDRGYQSPTYILMPSVSLPAVNFSSGFAVDGGGYLEDVSGKPLIEAFAVDLYGYLQLAPGMKAGRYEIASLSDDGSVVDIDTDKDGQLETLIDNDGYHSPRLECATQAVELEANSKLKIRLRYFQGPRQTIALTVVMRELASNEPAGTDPDCGFTDSGTSGRWYGEISTAPGYVPNLTTSKFGQLLKRGWFIPSKEMYGLPDRID